MLKIGLKSVSFIYPVDQTQYQSNLLNGQMLIILLIEFILIFYFYKKRTRYLIFTDVYCKWPEIFKITKMDAFAFIKKLRGVFARFGLPNIIILDNDPQFRSSEFKEFCKNNRIKLNT